jgi:hypothetical protein
MAALDRPGHLAAAALSFLGCSVLVVGCGSGASVEAEGGCGCADAAAPVAEGGPPDSGAREASSDASPGGDGMQGSLDVGDDSMEASATREATATLEATASGGEAAADSGDASALPAVAMAQPCAVLSSAGELLFELGHTAGTALLRQSGDRVLSEDGSGHWVLWDTTHRSQVTSGDAGPLPNGGVGLEPAQRPSVGGFSNEQPFGYFSVDLAGGTVVVASSTGLTLLSAVSGQVLQTIALPQLATVYASFGLATDGSYVWVTAGGSLNAWSTSGSTLVNLPILGANIFAAPTELRLGTAMQNGNPLLELISTVTGKIEKTQALPDPFDSWFLDGSRFLTADRSNNTTISVYTATGVKQDTQVLPFTASGIVGQGGYFWTEVPVSGNPNLGGVIEVFAVGGNAAPAWVAPKSSWSPLLPGWVPSGGANFVGFADPSTGSLDILDLSGPTVTESVVVLPNTPDHFDADFAGNWSASVGDLIFDSVDANDPSGPRSLDCGRVYTIAGAASGRVALSTEAGQILYVDLQPTTRTLLGTYDLAAGGLAISSDGSVLAAETSSSDLQVLDLPSGDLQSSWASADGGPSLAEFSLSLGGTTLAQITQTTNMTTRQITFTRKLADVATGSTYLIDAVTLSEPASVPPLALSPSGQLAALCDFPTFPPAPDATTNIYSGGRLSGAAKGYPVGWVDDAHLVVKTYMAPDSGTGPASYAGSSLCDPQGNVLGPLAVPDLNSFTPVGTTQIYAAQTNTIYNLSDGSVAWAGPDSPAGVVGDVAGGYVVMLSDHRVLLEAR